MRQYEPCIQIIIIRIKKKKDKSGKKKSQKGGEGETGEGEREKREREFFFLFLYLLLFKIYGNRIIGFCRSKRQSRSTHRELGNFSTCVISIIKVI